MLGKGAAIAKVWALVRECDESDWDGNGGKPVSEIVAQAAADLIRALPEDIPLPEFAPEPDGSIAVEWIQSRRRRVSVSVGTGNRLPYAWLDGADSGYGVASFDREAVPQSILGGIHRIMGGRAR